MDNFKYYFFILGFVNLISIFSSSYLYAEYNKTFRKMERIVFNISFRDFGGFLLYATDSDGFKLLIEAGNLYKTKEIYFNFNGHLFNKSITNFSNFINHFDVVLTFQSNSLKYDKNGVISDIFYMKPFFSDAFRNYPVPKDFTNLKNKVYFWIGNIGRYVGFKGRIYEPFTTPTFGCLNSLYVDDYSLEFIKEAEYFSRTCLHLVDEHLCVKDNCSLIKTKVNFLDCSFPSVNTKRMCYKDLIRTDNQSVVYKKFPDSNESTSFKIIWKQERFERFCLAEIDMKDGSYFIFYITENNELSKCFIENRFSPVCTKKSLFNVTTDEIHVLMFTFDNSQVLIKIFNGKYIQTFKDEFQRKIKQIKIGYSENTKSCVRFQGEITFRYDISQFKLICPSKIPSTPHKFYYFLSFGYSFFLTLLCGASCLIYFKSKFRRQSPTFESPYNGNNYESVEVQNMAFRPLPIPEKEEENLTEPVRNGLRG